MIYAIGKDSYSLFESLERLHEDECSYDIHDVRLLETKDHKNLICLEDYMKLVESCCSDETALAYVLKVNGDLDLNNQLAYAVRQESIFRDPLVEDTVKDLIARGNKVYIKPFREDYEVTKRLEQLCESAIKNNDVNILNSFLEEKLSKTAKDIAKNAASGAKDGMKEIYKDHVKKAIPSLKKSAAVVAGSGIAYLGGKKIAERVGTNWVKNQKNLPYQERSMIYHKLSALYKKRRDLFYAIKNGSATAVIRAMYNKINKIIRSLSNRLRAKKEGVF